MSEKAEDQVRKAAGASPSGLAVVAAAGCGPPAPTPASGCGCTVTQAAGAEKGPPSREREDTQAPKKVLNVELLVIDLESCRRCVPTGDQLEAAVRLLAPVAEVLGIELRHREIVVRTAEEAKARALLSSPTIRLNGRDIAQDIRESRCESCGDLTANGTVVDCREWHHRGKVYPAAPLPLLVEAIMDAMLDVEAPPAAPAPLADLPENLRRYFANVRRPARCC